MLIRASDARSTSIRITRLYFAKESRKDRAFSCRLTTGENAQAGKENSAGLGTGELRQKAISETVRFIR